MLLSLKLLQLCINGFCICVKCGSASKGKFCLIIVLTCVKMLVRVLILLWEETA